MDYYLDIHYRILIKRYGIERALDIMEKLLPSDYEDEIRLDREEIIWKKKPLYHCRNKWKTQDDYLKTRYDQTGNHLYLDILNNKNVDDEYIDMIKRPHSLEELL